MRTWLFDAHKIMIRKSKKEKNGYHFFFGVFYMYCNLLNTSDFLVIALYTQSALFYPGPGCSKAG